MLDVGLLTQEQPRGLLLAVERWCGFIQHGRSGLLHVSSGHQGNREWRRNSLGGHQKDHQGGGLRSKGSEGALQKDFCDLLHGNV